MGRQVDVRRFRGRGGEQYVRRRVLEFIGISGSFLGESERFVSMFLLCDVVFIEKKMGVRAVFSVVVHYLSEER